ncbi:MAG: PorT family protein [Bacteroidota bacterium]|nr:PorT family protein [Bacteroidota bacterium]
MIRAFLTFLLVSFFASARSQVYSENESATFSFTAGLTSSNLYNDSVSYKSGILFNGGLVYSLTLSPRINIAAEALLTGKAFKTDSPIVKYRFYYADIPLYAQLKFNEDVRLNLGGQFSKYLSSNSSKSDTAQTNGVTSVKFKNIKDIDLGFLAGIEVDINKNLTMAARYTISSDSFFNKDKVSFGVFQFSFRYCAWRSYKQFFAKKEASQ